MKSFKMILLFVALGAITLTSQAINVSGSVTGIWTAANNPYNVIGEINVPANQTLTIEPGVQVIFQGHYKFIVNQNGLLRAIGTEQDSIYFTASDTSVGWWGLRLFSARDSSRLEYCTFSHGNASGSNDDDRSGGSIFCNSSNITLTNCTLTENRATLYGGGICVANSDCKIDRNNFNYNTAYKGGAIWTFSGSVLISNNSFMSNSVFHSGGAIHEGSINGRIQNNLVVNNNCVYYGGGIVIDTNPVVSNNTIINNASSSLVGGGLMINTAYNISMKDCILWSNVPDQINVVSCPQLLVNNSDIQNGWPGTGNINADPCFTDGYHLRQNPPQTSPPYSPCVNASDPLSPMLTGTTRTDMLQDQGIVDMGYHYTPALPAPPLPPSNLVATLVPPSQITLTWNDNSNDEALFRLERKLGTGAYAFLVDIPANQTFYSDNSLPVGTYQYRLRAENQVGSSDWTYSNSVTISTPPPTVEINVWAVNPPIVIPYGGGQFQFNVNVHNFGTSLQAFSLWTNLLHIPSNTYYTGLGPINRALPGGANPTRILTQTVPGPWPSGNYYFIAYVGTYPSVISDTSYFEIFKSSTYDGGPWISEAKCEGDLFYEFIPADDVVIPTEYSLHQPYPNPFNPETTISFDLPQASRVNLSVYDILRSFGQYYRQWLAGSGHLPSYL
jgi:hypothetical protein